MSFIEIVDVLSKLAAIIGVPFLVLYTVKTTGLHKQAEKQNRTSIRPYLSYLPDPNQYTIRNQTTKTAVNVVLLVKISGQLKVLSDMQHIVAVGPKSQHTIERSQLRTTATPEMSRLMPDYEKLFHKLRSLETNCLCILYHDLDGNSLYTLQYGSGAGFGLAGETGYVEEIPIP